MIKEFKIQDWMTSKIGLNGNTLVLFAILWKMSDNGTRPVTVDYKEIRPLMGVTTPTFYNAMQILGKHKVITQLEDGQYAINAKCS